MPQYSSRTFYAYEARPNDFFTLNAEWDGPLAIDDPLVESDFNLFVTAFSEFQFTNVLFDRTVLGTWVPDGEPYDPTKFRTFQHGFFGGRSLLNKNPIDDTVGLFFRKGVSTGRNGKIYAKACLAIQDLESAQGSWQLTGLARTEFDLITESFYDTIRGMNLTMSLIGVSLETTIYPATPEGTKQVPVKVYSAVPHARTVTGITLVNPRERQENNN